MTNWTKTDEHQWQRKISDMTYEMWDIFKVSPTAYVIAHGQFDIDYYVSLDDLEEIASVFGYGQDELRENKALLAECIFEYNELDFIYKYPIGGPSVEYKYPEFDSLEKADQFIVQHIEKED